MKKKIFLDTQNFFWLLFILLFKLHKVFGKI